MKIDSAYKPSAQAVAPRQTTVKATAADRSQEAVSLSQLAGSLQGNEKPPVNSAKIQEIKQAISEGRFQINSEAIADRLIESARDLLNGNRKQQA